MPSAFEDSPDGTLGRGTFALYAIAGALWVPIAVYCLIVFAMLCNGRSVESMCANAVGGCDCSSHGCPHMCDISLPRHNPTMYLPKYPSPFDVERRNQKIVRPWSYNYPRPGITFPGNDPMIKPITQPVPVMNKVVPPTER